MCSSYPVFNLFSCSVRGIKQMQNSSGDSESPWNIPHCIFMSSVSISLFSVRRRIRVLLLLLLLLLLQLLLLEQLYKWRTENMTKHNSSKNKHFCAFSGIIIGDNQFCRIRAITCKGLHLANEIICSCTLFSVKLEYVLIRKASARLRKWTL